MKKAKALKPFLHNIPCSIWNRGYHKDSHVWELTISFQASQLHFSMSSKESYLLEEKLY